MVYRYVEEKEQAILHCFSCNMDLTQDQIVGVPSLEENVLKSS
jgi:hypothetical protein